MVGLGGPREIQRVRFGSGAPLSMKRKPRPRRPRAGRASAEAAHGRLGWVFLFIDDGALQPPSGEMICLCCAAAHRLSYEGCCGSCYGRMPVLGERLCRSCPAGGLAWLSSGL